jgi:hypothetical protein
MSQAVGTIRLRKLQECDAYVLPAMVFHRDQQDKLP